ncbi:MAG: S41 family peptidase [Opitutaceae bacterium]|jgi:carboxyl-terminal processing protease
MVKRILPVVVGVTLGFLLAGAAAHFGFGWNLFPNRNLNRSADYLREVLKVVNENYVASDKASFEKLTREAMHGMVETLDPHSEFLEAREFQDLDEEMRGDFGGIGIQVESRDGHFVVIAPIAGTPGDRAGISRGDEIISINGVAVGAGTPMDDIVDKLRGEPGTKVSLRLYRKKADKNIDLTIVRERIKVDSVREARVLEGGVGYIQLIEFSDRTGDEFADALDGLLKQGINSLVLDLRNNPGGLLDAAVYVSEIFFRKGELIVFTEGRRPQDHEEFRSENDGEPVNIPIAVLINAGSASAAEIVAGALKDTGKAVIVGERSFGKGSVQSIFKLRDGEGMRLTTARYFTPSGVTIHGKGIEPQVDVEMSLDDDENLRLQELRTDLKTPEQFKERFGFAPVTDCQLKAALDALKGIQLLRQRGLAVPKGEINRSEKRGARSENKSSMSRPVVTRHNQAVATRAVQGDKKQAAGEKDSSSQVP